MYYEKKKNDWLSAGSELVHQKHEGIWDEAKQRKDKLSVWMDVTNPQSTGQLVYTPYVDYLNGQYIYIYIRMP